MINRRGDGKVCHEDLVIAPVPVGFGLVGILNCKTEQGPLGSIIITLCVGQVGSQIPPLDPVFGVRAMILGKAESLTWPCLRI